MSLRRLASKLRRLKLPRIERAITGSTPSLPVELWLEIIRLLDDTNDVFALGLASTYLHTVVFSRFTALPLFPAGEDISFEDWIFHLQILRTFQSPQLAAGITRFRASISCFKRPNCMCSLVDKVLGKALQAMANLEMLEFECYMCQCDKGRHHYFAKLSARRLRSISLNCYCSHIDETVKPRCEKVLSAPLFNTVGALRWFPGILLYAPPNIELKNSTDLPNLTALAYRGTSLENTLLATRPIQRLCVDAVPNLVDFLEALDASPGVLTHVIFPRFGLIGCSLQEKPAQFTNIQHIGTLRPYTMHNHMLYMFESQIKLLDSLPHLVSVDVFTLNSKYPSEMDITLLVSLRDSHPKLRKILVHRPSTLGYMLKLNGSNWEMQELQYFTVWDIILGVIDDV